MNIIYEEIKQLKKEIQSKVEYCSLSDEDLLEISQELDILIIDVINNSIKGKEKTFLS